MSDHNQKVNKKLEEQKVKKLEEWISLPIVLLRLILQYCTERLWETTAFTSWKIMGGYPKGISSDSKHLYVCQFTNHKISIFNPSAAIIGVSDDLKYPYGIDIDQSTSLVYIGEQTQVTILNLQLERLSAWKLPSSTSYFRGLKVDGPILYLTLAGENQIFLCDKTNGTVLNKWGTLEESSSQGKFKSPMGLTVDNKYVYVCDNGNHRIQVLTKDKGLFLAQWGNGRESTDKGQFNGPLSAYHDLSDEIIYIGDTFSVQLLTKEGICIQRLGDKKGNNMNQFNGVYGVSVIGDRLYVSDDNNLRILIFALK